MICILVEVSACLVAYTENKFTKNCMIDSVSACPRAQVEEIHVSKRGFLVKLVEDACNKCIMLLHICCMLHYYVVLCCVSCSNADVMIVIYSHRLF